MNPARLVNVAPVLPTPDVRRTAAYYRDALGFKVVEHYDAEEAFATLYRDSVELVLIQTRHGDVQSNTARYGVGFDVYIDPETVEAVDSIYEELQARGRRRSESRP
jgi:catechol 2,3-dioxygenase-like lactoylglutathione lyase family enzyme